jgi:hypothetical protein
MKRIATLLFMGLIMSKNKDTDVKTNYMGFTAGIGWNYYIQ